MHSQYNEFIFETFSFERETGTALLEYSFDGQIHFCEKLQFDVTDVDWQVVNKDALERALSALHLAGGVSYYKAACPSHIALKNHTLSKAQAAFWNKFYTRGLAEFFFTNEIDPTGLINFPFDEDWQPPKAPELNLPETTLVPIGGGKDSITTAEILKRGGRPFTLFSLNDPKAIRDTAEIVGQPRIIVKRVLTEHLFELNAKGAFNGHVPITGYLSFVLITTAILNGVKHLVMSLEKSADYAQAISNETEINHQYSKSSEFESDLSIYLKNYIASDIYYFSLLRPFHELKIAQIFAALADPDYLDLFTSCNSNFKQQADSDQTKWCGACPKCAFVFAMLAPFIPAARLRIFFGKNLFAEKSLLDTFRSLLGLTDQLPFECVGSAAETKCALWMVHAESDYKNTPVITMFRQEVLPTIENPQELKQELFAYHATPQIPEAFENLLEEFKVSDNAEVDKDETARS